MAHHDGTQRSRGKAGAGKAKGRRAVRARHGGSTEGATSRVSLYDEVTAKIIAQLEAGCFPWAQPWSSAAAVPGLPRNAVSGRPYSGVNVLILWGAVIEGCYPSQDWLTFWQALAAGGCVRKGERGQTIFYADRFTPDNERDGGEAQESEPRSIPFLKRFVVFNAAQCDGLSRQSKRPSVSRLLFPALCRSRRATGSPSAPMRRWSRASPSAPPTTDYSTWCRAPRSKCFERRSPCFCSPKTIARG